MTNKNANKMREKMKNLFRILTLLCLLVAGAGCSTMGNFKIPEDTTLKVTDRMVTPDAAGEWSTSPFFWSSTGGAHYQLYDKSGKLIRSGKLKTNFRIVSIFWPPFALIYWPMGLSHDGYDLTRPGDGYMVQDEMVASSSSEMNATTSAPTLAPPASKKSKKRNSKSAAKTNAAPVTNAAPAEQPAQ